MVESRKIKSLINYINIKIEIRGGLIINYNLIWDKTKKIYALTLEPEQHLIGSQQGSYLLLIHLDRKLELVFGRFKNGMKIPLNSGYYVYIGSALSPKGSTSLGNRLQRHCLRTSDKNHQPILIHLHKLLDELDIHYTQHPSKKTLFWNIDHLLDKKEAFIKGIIFIQCSDPLENKWSEYIAQIDKSQIVEQGLGANDCQGHTHIQFLNLNEDMNILDWWGNMAKSLPTE